MDVESRAVAPSGMSASERTVFAGLLGIVTAACTVALAEVVSLLLGGAGNPINAVGSFIIDIVPPGFKTLVIDLFGTADKAVLFGSIGLLLLVLAVAVGLLQVRRPPWGIAALGLFALVAILAAITRAGAGLLDALPTLLGAAAGALLLSSLTRRFHAWREAPARRGLASAAAGRAGRYERRSFLLMLGVAGVASAVVGAGARALSAAASAVSEARAALTLPAAASAAPPIPADAIAATPGISPYITPNADFYRIDTALQVPSIEPDAWRLRITGMVEQEVEIGFAELLALPLEERVITLTCVSNDVGGDLIGNALWLGYPIRNLLARARPTAGADMVLSRSQDGFTAGTPLEVLQDEKTDALLAVGMNGEFLPIEHGFPVRMVVPGLYGYVSATKWVVELKVTSYADDLAYWSTRGWTERGPIKLSSRIDTPRAGRSVAAGTVAIAGVAWAQHTGISRVQLRIDEGQWLDATLAPTVTVDSWLQWSYAWDALPGDHRIEVRATDADGLVQTAKQAPPAPDGSTGLHGIAVRVD